MQTELHPCGSGKGKPLPPSIADRIRLAVERIGWTPIACCVGRDHLHVVCAARTFDTHFGPRRERVCWYYSASDNGLHQGRYTVLGNPAGTAEAAQAWVRRVSGTWSGQIHRF